MALPIISAAQRLAQKQGVKLVLLGKSGIGKTSQLKTLPEASTLFVDLEAGDLAVRDWQGDCVRPATWPEFRDLVVFLAGPNPALPADAPYSQAHYSHVCERYGDPAQLARYGTYFVDSITVLARLALIWAKTQPQAQSDRTGKPDTRGAYGLLGAEMLTALTHLQHARGKNVVFVAILDEKLDDFNRKVFVPQIEGSKTAAELPGIVDEVVTLAEIKAEDGSAYRAFVTHTLNPYGYPAKDRSGQLEVLEPPDLHALIAKCAAATRAAAGKPPAKDSAAAVTAAAAPSIPNQTTQD
ncbi:ATP-binding protein [Ottowia testudinis]|uniref:ATP-binding protein n=1 Tax=Ottowia testudinis TaxID=2816950 RepID=A0A975CH58_9BURK|nr:ATP-binding protein [Ottowia testudinis]QTD44996.1 ATP-binding protein [Ottowia testudinis]